MQTVTQPFFHSYPMIGALKEKNDIITHSQYTWDYSLRQQNK